ncbi:MAG: extracellular solute-binding protein [Clostridium sp.]|nr:extracellular solute-binding protein [Clostridium sp.]
MQKWMLTLILGFGMLTFIGCNDGTSSVLSEDYAEQTEVAMTTPFGKYPEEVVYTLGKMTGANNSNMPAGDTFENNAYTRYLKKTLNIQNINVFEESADYDNVVSMAITAEDLPDVMVVSDMEQLQLLIEKDLIEDLTQVYKDCTSDTIKAIYNSYGNEILENVTRDGKLMALPETNIENGPSLIWLRKDWMNKLGLEDPKNLGDVENIIRQFIAKDPGGNGKGNTIGLVSDANLVGEAGYSYEYQLDLIFATYGAYPKQWIYNAAGELVYGSTQPEAKQALERLQEMYKEGILDPQFLLRSTDNIIELIKRGKSGSFFGPWWAPNNPLIEAKKFNPNAEWQPYLISTDEDGTTSYVSQNPSYKYVVVRKGYEHPEIVMKIVSVLFDYARFQDEEAYEVGQYYKLNVDPTARPLAINVDFADALMRCYKDLVDVFSGKKTKSDLKQLELSYYDACAEYLERGSFASVEDWAAYTSRITACGVIDEGRTEQVKSLFFGETETMQKQWWKLKKMEEEYYLQIITGEASIEEFDKFVHEWKQNGGEIITEEVRQCVER